MFTKENSGRALSVCVATSFTCLIFVMVLKGWPGTPFIVMVPLCTASFAATYLVWTWIFNKKIPTSSTELRRRRREFYAWLETQGHRNRRSTSTKHD